MTDLLDRIVSDTRRRLERERPDVKALEREARVLERTGVRGSFATALQRRSEHANIIAEIKAASPSAGPIAEAPDVEAIANAYARGGAAALSVVTEPLHFRGDRSWIARARQGGDLPVVMKDFVVEEVQLLEGIVAGAGAILLLASHLDASRIRSFISFLDDWGADALVEVHDERELERALGGQARIIGVNNRDLRDFSISLETSERLSEQIPADRIRVSESGIRTRGDVQRLQACGFDAFLVGTSLLRQDDREAAVRQLLGGAE